MKQFALLVSTIRQRSSAARRLGVALMAMRNQSRQRGVTLVEVLIVVAIMAMIAGGVAVFALPKFREAQVSTARTNATTLRGAIQQWQMSNNEVSCPTISQLVQEKHIDKGSDTNDPWGNPYTLTCTEDEIVVSSKGPDKKKGTDDDISVPKVGGATEN